MYQSGVARPSWFILTIRINLTAIRLLIILAEWEFGGISNDASATLWGFNYPWYYASSLALNCSKNATRYPRVNCSHWFTKEFNFAQEHRSGNKSVVLRGVQRELTAYYKCEVSGDQPTFHTDVKSALMLVVGKGSPLQIFHLQH